MSSTKRERVSSDVRARPAWLNGAVGFALDPSDPFPTGFGM
ncbi:hypothetical protein [Arthrobacter sp. AZCC_0090]|nr:hypothetical protein [Arthrobacter sp. AZCC_0090]MBB6405160.1 proline racemase [Arthrobacter sp. AZCC_0090]